MHVGACVSSPWFLRLFFCVCFLILDYYPLGFVGVYSTSVSKIPL